MALIGISRRVPVDFVGILAHKYPGADFSEKVLAAIAAAPDRETIDARGFTGTQVISQTITAGSKRLKLLLPGSLRVTAAVGIDITSSLTLQGSGLGVTQIEAGADGVILLRAAGTAENQISEVTIADITLNGRNELYTGVTGADCLYLNRAYIYNLNALYCDLDGVDFGACFETKVFGGSFSNNGGGGLVEYESAAGDGNTSCEFHGLKTNWNGFKYRKLITNIADNGSGLYRITSTGHGYSTDDEARLDAIVGTGGLPAALNDKIFTITVIDPDTFDLQGTSFTGEYTSGGTAEKCTGRPDGVSQTGPSNSIFYGLQSDRNAGCFAQTGASAASAPNSPQFIGGVAEHNYNPTAQVIFSGASGIATLAPKMIGTLLNGGGIPGQSAIRCNWCEDAYFLVQSFGHDYFLEITPNAVKVDPRGSRTMDAVYFKEELRAIVQRSRASGTQEALILAQQIPTSAGTRDSHTVRLMGGSYDTAGHTVEWETLLNVTSNAGASTLFLRHRIDGGAWTTGLRIRSNGELVITGDPIITAGTAFEGRLTSLLTDNRQWTLPDVNTVLAGLGVAQTWTQQQGFDAVATFNAAISALSTLALPNSLTVGMPVQAITGGVLGSVRIDLSDGTNQVQASNQANARAITGCQKAGSLSASAPVFTDSGSNLITQDIDLAAAYVVSSDGAAARAKISAAQAGGNTQGAGAHDHAGST